MKEHRIWMGLPLRGWLGVGLGLGLVAGLTVFLIRQGPKKIDLAHRPVGMTGEQWRISREIDEVEQRYRQLAADVLPSPEMERALMRAIERQEQLLQVNPPAAKEQSIRLDRLYAARDTTRAQRQWPQVETLEKSLQTNLPPEERTAAFDELLRLRQAINRSHAAARYKDLVRETQVERELEMALAGPLQAKVDEAESLAQKEAARENWTEALGHYSRAREIMEDINRRFARSRYADLARQNKLRTEELSLEGAGESAEIEVYVQGAGAALADRPELAAEYYQRAITVQKQLNERWPQSRFVSTRRLDELEEQRQTVLAGALIAQWVEEDAGLQKILAGRQALAAARNIAELELMSRQLTGEYPRSRLSDRGLGRKYAFLVSLGEGIRDLQDQVYDQLVPLPRTDGLMLLRDEVSQGLYTQIMKFNPSRTPGELLAVESLSWQEAEEFCRRLGWVMGRRVRLPARDEIAAALADAVESSRDKSAIPSGEIYANLTGNVAEWLAAAEESAEAPVLAAEGADGGDVSRQFSSRPKNTRSRELGFRVVVELTPL